jgi:hypothetical protein
MKKVSSISFIVLLLLSMATVVIATPWDGVPDDINPAQAIWVDPENTTGLGLGDIFTVDVLVNVSDPDGGGAATGLYGFEYKLKWDNTWLSAVEIQTHSDAVPGSDLLPGWTSVYIASNITGTVASDDYHGYAVSATGGVAFAGVDSLCTYKFQVLQQPTFPSPDYLGYLDIYDDILVDDTATPIPHATVDGDYVVEATTVEPPKVGVDPDYVLGVYGENFTVDIVIEPAHPLFAAWNMCGWEAKLSYNTTHLDALACIEGAWFAGFAGPNGTYPVCNINDTAGIVHMANLYLGPHTAPSGTGVLMTIVFNASWMYTVPPGIPPVISALDLFDVLLVNCDSQPIDLYGVNDGEYEAPYQTLGWSLDCWTDSFRKKCWTPFTGEGPNATADAYEPHDMVILYAYLTFNEWPQQNWIVTFEIYGPVNPYENITIFRTAITNASGIATINFTIPWPCEYSEEIIFGKWICYQYAQVKDPWAGEDEDYSARPFDILKWDVGWIVELLDVTVEPDPISPCETANITVFYKNIMQIPKWVVITVTIYDTLLDPIGSVIGGFEAPPGLFCDPYYGSVVLYIHIPKWAHVGPGATVFVNAFTALPSHGGCVYCTEISATFTIQVPP